MQLQVVRTQDVPVADRWAYWLELVSNSARPGPTMSGEVRSEHTADFHGEIRYLDLGSATLTSLSYPTLTFDRTPSWVRRADPDFYQFTQMTSSTRLSTRRGETELAPGDFTLYGTFHPCKVQASSATQDMIIFGFPRDALPLPRGKVDKILAAKMAQNGLGLLAARFLRSTLETAPALAPEDAHRVGTVAIDLITSFVGGHLGGSGGLSPREHRDALLLRVRTYIETHLGEADLSPSSIAAAHHISLRSLHLLFQPEDTTVAAHIRTRRLERARQDLADPLLTGLPIAAIAARWGFPRPADFSKTFKRAYGRMPSDARAASHEQQHR